jgi:GTP1/Obg family GTP-binding protein
MNPFLRKSEEVVRIDFTEEELAEFKNELASNLITIGRETEKLDEAKQVYKEAVKPILESNKLLLENIKTGSKFITGVFSLVPNYERGIMQIIDEDGV